MKEKHDPWCECMVCMGLAVWTEDWLATQRERDELLEMVKKLKAGNPCGNLHTQAQALLDKVGGKK